MIELGREADVMAGFVHNGTVAECFLSSFLNAFAEDTTRHARGGRRRLVEYFAQRGPYIHANRCLVVDYFLEHTNCQWLWFLDNDMEFPPDALHRLLAAAEEHDCGILGAAYWNQYGASSQSASKRYLSWLLFTEEGIRAVERIPPDHPDPVEVSAVGMGCTLIHRQVLQDVADMHTNHPWSTFGADLLRYDDGSADVMGEDVTFCMRAMKAGHKTYGLPTLVAEHFKAIFLDHEGDALGNGHSEVLSEELITLEKEKT